MGEGAGRASVLSNEKSSVDGWWRWWQNNVRNLMPLSWTLKNEKLGAEVEKGWIWN